MSQASGRSRRVYHYHVRKTAGTSLNSAFWDLGGLDLRSMRGKSDATSNGLRFVRFKHELIKAGDYFFANSHFPMHALQLPPDTFTVTILRDPAARTISYYRYLKWWHKRSDGILATPKNQILQPIAHKVENMVKDGFEAFLERVPPHDLRNQLATFSEQMDPQEAVENVMKCAAVCFTETFSADLANLAGALDLDLREKHERRVGETVQIDEADQAALRARLALEYEMIERVRDRVNGRTVLAGARPA